MSLAQIMKRTEDWLCRQWYVQDLQQTGENTLEFCTTMAWSNEVPWDIKRSLEQEIGRDMRVHTVKRRVGVDYRGFYRERRVEVVLR